MMSRREKESWLFGAIAALCLTLLFASAAARADEYRQEIAFGPGSMIATSATEQGDNISASYLWGSSFQHEVEIGWREPRDGRKVERELPDYYYVAYQRRFYTRNIKNTKLRFYASFGGMIHNLNEQRFDDGVKVGDRWPLPSFINFRGGLGFRWQPKDMIGIETRCAHDSNSGLSRGANISENECGLRYVVRF